MARFVDVYHTVTGQKARVPESFLGHPVIGKMMSATPKAVAAVAAAAAKASNDSDDGAPRKGAK